MLRTNRASLPIISVQGQVWHPKYNRNGTISVDGEVKEVIGTGGIAYNARIGSPAVGWEADHLEPGVSSKNPVEDFNSAYCCFSCVGNRAEVISGKAEGASGFVTGKHGGVEHVMIYFDDDTLYKLNVDDKIRVFGCGQGMRLLDYPDVYLRNMSPELLDKMTITEEDGKLRVSVAKIVPQSIMGSGIGRSSSVTGDYDITLFDEKVVEEYGLSDLRFGDIVCIENADGRFGRSWYTGAATIGVVIHGDSYISGHGPGVTVLMTSKKHIIEPVVDRRANLADMFLGSSETGSRQ
jgi:hypothetical protein